MKFTTLAKSPTGKYRLFPGATFDVRLGRTDRQTYILPRPDQPTIRVCNNLLMSRKDALMRYSSNGHELTVLKASLCCGDESMMLVKPAAVPVAMIPPPPAAHCLWIPSPLVHIGPQPLDFRGQVLSQTGLVVLWPGCELYVSMVDRNTKPGLVERLTVWFNGEDLTIEGVPLETPASVRFY